MCDGDVPLLTFLLYISSRFTLRPCTRGKVISCIVVVSYKKIPRSEDVGNRATGMHNESVEFGESLVSVLRTEWYSLQASQIYI